MLASLPPAVKAAPVISIVPPVPAIEATVSVASTS